MTIDDEKSALICHLGQTRRIDAEFAEEIPQMHLDVGVLAQYRAELLVTLACSIFVGGSEVFSGHADQRL